MWAVRASSARRGLEAGSSRWRWRSLVSLIFLPQWYGAFDEYNKRSIRAGRSASDALASEPVAGMVAAKTLHLANAHFRLKPGQHRKLRLHLSRAQARALVCSSRKAGKARFAVVRLIVAISAQPHPAVRVYDIRIRIKGHPSCK